MLTAVEEQRLAELARQYQHEYPDLKPEGMFQHLRMRDTVLGAALQIDDSSSITGMEYHPQNLYLQDRARWRAGSADIVASCTARNTAYEDYIADRLLLGRPTWLRVDPCNDPLKLAANCWKDRATRRRLTELLQKGRFTHIHPYIGSFHVWALGALLSKATNMRLAVLAPPPGLARRVNDKCWFTTLVRQVFGDAFRSRSFEAYSYSPLARLIRVHFDDVPRIIIKLPDSAGGKGNLVLETKSFRDA